MRHPTNEVMMLKMPGLHDWIKDSKDLYHPEQVHFEEFGKQPWYRPKKATLSFEDVELKDCYWKDEIAFQYYNVRSKDKFKGNRYTLNNMSAE